MSVWSYMSQVILTEQFGYQLQGYSGDLSDCKILKCDDDTASALTCALPDRNFESWKQRVASEPRVPIFSPLNDLPQQSWAAALVHLHFQWGKSLRSCLSCSPCINLMLMRCRLFHKLFSKGFWQWFHVTRLLFISPAAFFRLYPPIPYNY